MLKSCDDADKVLQQLNVTIASYDSLMKQLEVDISMVESEKKNLTELLQDYIQNIHKNLARIGSNSTIKIREKSLKMLKITLPVWEDNEKLYNLRLSDFVDEITEEGIHLFENNENAQEYIGRKVTSKNLYDTVVGIGNVQIQLYKIEEQRERQISWNQVARNSGGEGFLSAFVILSSLLDYMRKDDSDIFMDMHEGKVLLMDNPFAQTNAEHLLKPLMNLAEKTNTQLICLTGLGGESIYNRFDNIYVLNLIEAHLRNGIQYLRSEHKKGEEKEIIPYPICSVVAVFKMIVRILNTLRSRIWDMVLFLFSDYLNLWFNNMECARRLWSSGKLNSKGLTLKLFSFQQKSLICYLLSKPDSR